MKALKGIGTGITIIISTVIAAVGLVVASFAFNGSLEFPTLLGLFTGSGDPEITTSLVMRKLETASDLTTARMTYTGITSFKDGDIPVLNATEAYVMYSAEISAGINMNDVHVVELTDDRVVIEIPEIVIQSVHVDANSVDVYEVRDSIFGSFDNDELLDIISDVEEDLLDDASDPSNDEFMSFRNTARTQIESIFECILADSVGDRTIEFRTASDDSFDSQAELTPEKSDGLGFEGRG